MAEVYATPDHVSPEPQEVSVDTLAQEELEGMQSRLSPPRAVLGPRVEWPLYYIIMRAHLVRRWSCSFRWFSSCVGLRPPQPNPPSLFLRVLIFPL